MGDTTGNNAWFADTECLLRGCSWDRLSLETVVAVHLSYVRRYPNTVSMGNAPCLPDI